MKRLVWLCAMGLLGLMMQGCGPKTSDDVDPLDELDAIEDLILLGDSYLARLEAAAWYEDLPDATVLPAGTYTPEQLTTQIETYGLVERSFHLWYQGWIAIYWEEFKEHVDSLDDMSEGVLSSYQMEVERVNSSLTGTLTIDWTVHYLMQGDWMRVEFHSHNSEDWVQSVVLELDLVEDQVHARLLRINEPPETSPHNRQQLRMEVWEDGRLTYLENTGENLDIQFLEYHDPNLEFFYQHRMAGDGIDTYRIYDPSEQVLVFQHIDTGGTGSEVDMTFFADGTPVLRVIEERTGDTANYDIAWGLTACTGWTSFTYVDGTSLGEHPYNTTDWRMHQMNGTLYLVGSSEDISSLDGHLSPTHNTLTCDALSVSEVETFLSLINAAYYDALMTPYDIPDLPTEDPLTVEEEHLPE